MSEIARSLVLMGGMVVFCLSVLGVGLFAVWLFFRVLERFSERGYSAPGRSLPRRLAGLLTRRAR